MYKQKWMNKPVTFGGYTALKAVCAVIGMVACACYYIAWVEPAWWTRFKAKTTRLFTWKTCEK